MSAATPVFPMSPPTYLFVSDLHLAAETMPAVEQFGAFLASEAREADALYILGDLFEAWVGDDDDEPVRKQVCAALRDLRLLNLEKDFEEKLKTSRRRFPAAALLRQNG